MTLRPSGTETLDLFGAHRLAGAQQLRDGDLAQGNLAAVGAANGDDLQQLLHRAAKCAQALHHAPRLAVERHRAAGSGVEHPDADRGDLDQGFEIGARAALVAVGAGVDDRRRRLRGEQHEHLLVLVGERRPRLLLAEEEGTDLRAAVAHGRALEGLDAHPVGGTAERADIGGHVGYPQRRGQIAQHLEDPHVVRPLLHHPLLLGREAGEDDDVGLTRIVDGGDDGVAGVGQRAGGFADLANHGGDVEARADAQDGGGERGDPLAQGLVLPAQVVALAHGSVPPQVQRRT